MNARSATYSPVDGSVISYTVTATNTADSAKSPEPLELAPGETTFEIKLVEGTYTLSVEGFLTEGDGRKKILYGEAKNTVTVNDATPNPPAGTIYVNPIFDGDEPGQVNLAMTISDSCNIKSLTAVWRKLVRDDDGKLKEDESTEKTRIFKNVDGSNLTTVQFTMTEESENASDGVSAGFYRVYFHFYTDAAQSPGTELYSCSESINVYQNLMTDVWRNDAATPYIKDGTFTLTSSIIRHTFFVDKDDPNASPTNEGTAYFPFDSVKSAVRKICSANDADMYTIVMLSDDEDGSQDSDDYIDISPSSPLTLTIIGNNRTINANRTADRKGAVLRVVGEKTAVTLKNVNITGGYDNMGGGIYNDGTLTVSGGTISGCYADYGGGIYNYGTLTVTGGTIENCTANAAGAIYNAGTLTVSGGSIENCTAGTSGGGIYNDVTDASITCTLTDCTISGCKALGTESGQGGGGICNNAGTLELTDCTITGGGDTGNPDARYGSGVYNNGTLKMTDGSVTKCTATYSGGIYNRGTLTITEGTISSCTATYNGGGVYNDGTFTMTGGTIGGTTDAEKNTSVRASGGGVFISSNGTFTMTDGTISKNVAAVGGGVGISSGTFTMIGGEISGNTVINSGGGVYINGDGSTFTMKGGAISGNVCSSGGTGNGGGVCVVRGSFTMKGGTISGNEAKKGGGVYNSSTFTMESDAEISGNTATDRGGGVMSNGTFTMGGSASVPAGDDGKNDVYLASGKTIGIASTLTAESPVATIKPAAYTDGTKVLELTSNSTATLADECEKFAVTAESDGTEWLIAEDGTLQLPVPEGFVRVEGGTITGTETWTPSSSVFVSGRTVAIHDMYVSDHEITQEEYEAYCTYGSSSPSSGYGVGNNYPAYYVSWYDAVVYCNLRSIAEGLTPAYKMGTETDPKNWSGIVASGGKYCGPSSTNADWNAITYDEAANGWRLPTEAEWEYIARGGKTPSGTTYSGSETVEDVAWCTTNSGSKAHEVKGQNANALDIYDMSGNVWEWCWDWNGTVASDTPGTGSASGSYRVYRGGSWDDGANYCRVSYRSYNSPYSRFNSVGFRVVRSSSK